jgi:hypothetical protein
MEVVPPKIKKGIWDVLLPYEPNVWVYIANVEFLAARKRWWQK